MKKILSIALASMLFSTTCFADCDFSLGIKPLADGGYEYTKDCHSKVGVMNQQLTDLQKALDLKDQALKLSDQRTQLWMDTAFKMEDKVSNIDRLQKDNNILYFTLGGVTVVLVGFAVASLTRRH